MMIFLKNNFHRDYQREFSWIYIMDRDIILYYKTYFGGDCVYSLRSDNKVERNYIFFKQNSVYVTEITGYPLHNMNKFKVVGNEIVIELSNSVCSRSEVLTLF